jgi:hypothetical protein
MNRIKILEDAWKENKVQSSNASEYEVDDIIENTINMSLNSIKSIADMITDLATNLNEKNAQHLAKPWIASKLTLAENYISEVHNQIKYHVELPEDKLEKPETEQEDVAFFGNFDGHDGHSTLKKDKSDYESGNF